MQYQLSLSKDSTLLNRLVEGMWSEGRPVFKKVDGEPKFLLVAEGISRWHIMWSTTANRSWIISGKATNSPSSPEAGASVKMGLNRWRYYDVGSVKWTEGDISVSCL